MASKRRASGANATQELHRLGARIAVVWILLHHRARCSPGRSLYCRGDRGRLGSVGGTGAHLGQHLLSLPHALLFLWQRQRIDVLHRLQQLLQERQQPWG